jgi:hypothetical protein
MKQKLKPLVVSLCLLGLTSVHADPAADQANHANQPNEAVSSQTQDIEKQLSKLQHDVRSLKKQVRAQQKNNAPQTQSASNDHAPTTSSATTSSGPDSFVTPNDAHEQVTYFPIDVDVPGQSFVSTGPYIGVPLMYSGGNLIINSPSVNYDVALLNIRKKIRDKLHALGHHEAEDHAHLLLSGTVEGQAVYKHPGVGPSTSDIDLTNAQLDGYILAPSSWTSGLMSLSYDNDLGTNEGSLNNNSRVQNSRVFINKAFIVLGDFSRSPFYSSLGQMYVPFGTYSTNLVSSPLTKILGRTKARTIVVGYQEQATNALYAAGYVFKGDSYEGSTSRINDGGLNLGYRFVKGDYSGDFGGGLLGDIADSMGMQNNGNGANGPFFGGFGADNGFGNEQIAHRVPAMNLRGLFSIGSHIDLLAEYIGALNSFSTNDLTFNTHGAKPQALNAEAAYTFQAFDRPTTVAIGYGKSKDALALELPAQRYSLVLNTSWWKDTLQSLEFRHDINYAAGNYASGTGSAVSQVINGSGKPDNMVTAQFDIYF